MEMMPQQHNNWPFIINVGNSIIGVTILAMPFCFQQCGVVLGSLMLCFSTWLTIKSCQLLVKAGVTSRRRSFSHLAYFTHGAMGKLLVELCMIGLQLGTLVAQVVIIGDLGPAIVSKATGYENTSNLRTSLIVALCLFVGLPLGLLKDLRTLSKASTMCILFYTFFTCYVVLQSIPNLLHGDWYTRIRFWRMEGFFQCLPIFSFAFGCQTQLFIVYNAMADPSIKRINGIISSAVLLCFAAYLLVAFFGYIAFSNEKELTGDIINHFSENTVSDAIKLCFVISIAVSIPLIVFPCRTSLYTLLFPQKPKEDVPGSAKIPEQHFQVITAAIIVGAMVTGILVPNVEFVLGLTGATMGTLICYIFPALFFIHVMSEASEGRFSSKIVLISGLTILIASTYITLNPPEKVPDVIPLDTDLKDAQVDVADILDQRKEIKKDIKSGVENERVDLQEKNKPPDIADVKQEEKRHEPPIPQEPFDTPEEMKDDKKENIQKRDKIENNDEPNMRKQGGDINKMDELKEKDVAKDNDKTMNKDSFDKVETINDEVKMEDKVKKSEEEKAKKKKEEEEEKERKEEEERKRVENEKKQQEILNKLEQQQEEQQKLIEEQKEILEELKQHKDEHKEAPQDQNVQVPVQPQGQIQNQGQGIQQQVNVGQIPLQQVQGQIPLQQGQGQIPMQQGQALQMQQGIGQIPLQGQIPMQQGQGGQVQQNQGQIPLQQGQTNFIQQNPVINQPLQQQLPNQVLVQNNQGILPQGGLNQQLVNQNMGAQGIQNMNQFVGQNIGNNLPQGQNINAGLNVAGNMAQGIGQNIGDNLGQNFVPYQGKNVAMNIQNQIAGQNVAQNQKQIVAQNIDNNPLNLRNNVEIQNAQNQQQNKKQLGQQKKKHLDQQHVKKEEINDEMKKDEDKQNKEKDVKLKNDVKAHEKSPADQVKGKSDAKIALNNDLDKMKHRGKRDVDTGIEENKNENLEVDKKVKLDTVENNKEINDKDTNHGENVNRDHKKMLTEKDDKKGDQNNMNKENVEDNKNKVKYDKQTGLDSVKEVKNIKEAEVELNDKYGKEKGIDNVKEVDDIKEERKTESKDVGNGNFQAKEIVDKASDKNGQRDLKMIPNQKTDLANDVNPNDSKDYVDEVIENMKNKLLYENSKRVQGFNALDNSKLRR